MLVWLPPSLALALALSLGHVLVAPVAAQEDCDFVMGFAALRDRLGADTIGACLEHQRTVDGGDAEQRTTRGLLVWRWATNRVLFTDGYRTWIDGPHGLQVRLNSEQFEWEAVPPARPAPPTFGQWLQAYVRAVRAGDAWGIGQAYLAAADALAVVRASATEWLRLRLAGRLAQAALLLAAE